jgi:hypothetical protein
MPDFKNDLETVFMASPSCSRSALPIANQMLPLQLHNVSVHLEQSFSSASSGCS